MNTIEIILSKQIKIFLEQVKRLSDMSHSRSFSRKSGGFPVFFEDKEYNEQSFFDEQIENLIWRILVNGVLKALFSDDYCESKQLRCEWQSMHPQHTSSYVEIIEEQYPIEFTINVDNGNRIGFRYTNCYWSEKQMETVINCNNLDEIRIIDFSSSSISAFLHPLLVSQKYTKYVKKETLEEFFIEFFTKSEFDIYLQAVKNAVDEANRYVGLQTIPNMTLQYRAYFIKRELKDIGERELAKEEYKIINANEINGWLKERIERSTDIISNNDYRIMDENFFDHRRYYAMCGTESFAHSFLTSEYLYQIMKSNNHFDYTSIVAGYLKSIEQLLYKTVLFTLSMNTERELWIKAKYVKTDTPPEIRKFRGTNHVKFIPENEEYFDTSFASLVNLLDANIEGWSVTKKAKNRIITSLFVFCSECRNEHFHKDNISIDNIDEVDTIRHNSIMLFYYLLGAYSFSGSVKKDREILGIEDRRYDDLYQAIIECSGGGDYFLIQFESGQKNLCAFPINHGMPEYDENGLMTNSRLRFVKISRDIDEDWHKDNWSLIEADKQSEKNIFITPENMPVSIQFVDKISGKRTNIEW